MKKVMLLLMAFTVFFAVAAHDSADARRMGGGFKSPRQSFKTPAKPADNVRRADPATKSPGAAAGTTPRRGFFSGGGLMRGLLIGGLAGMLFGGMFAGMGAFGNFLGLLINLFAIYAVIMIIRSIFIYFRQNKRTPDDRRRY
jgi:predicted lipid-binding transport protein (Tim44 family)